MEPMGLRVCTTRNNHTHTYMYTHVAHTGAASIMGCKNICVSLEFKDSSGSMQWPQNPTFCCEVV